MRGDWFFVLVFVFVVAVMWAGFAFLLPDARLRRRRRKSNQKVISRSNRPSVHFSVKVPKDKK